jgi:catechol 2,3-dioxygenase-like lactoylglutathione lyase family enzyme
MPPACELDHIVIAAQNLDAGVRFIRDKLGVDIPPGGRHESMGTHNHVMRLGRGSFLEVIAIDPAASAPGRPRWFDLDDPAMAAPLREGPRLVAWVIRTTDIVAAVNAAAISLGTITPLRRDALSWRLTVPDDGHMPGGGTIPHIIEWDAGLRPWEQMADLGCSLAALTLADPDGDWLNEVLRSLGAEALPSVKVVEGGPPRLSAKIVTPSGRIASI